MKVLVLFSGTRSFEKIFEKKNIQVRCLDIDTHFKPYYNFNILEWDYKNLNFVPDYIHASPVCKEFTQLKNCKNHTRNLELGNKLLNKTLEIIEYFKNINPKMKFTIENPKGLMRKQECMKKYNRITTSYCMYGLKYKKPTDFWYGGFDLKLKLCRDTKDKNNWCEFKLNNKIDNRHPVRIGFVGETQITADEYYRQSKKDFPEKYGNFKNCSHFLYQIPDRLCESIIEQVII